MKLLICAFILLTLAAGAQAAPTPLAGGSRVPPNDGPCLTPEQRARIWADIRTNEARLRQEGRLPQAERGAIVLFDWPLRGAPAMTDFGYHGISNFVDQDPNYPDQLLDYNCGDRTYDLASGYNHQGIDYFSWPFSWYKMDNELVEIVAAAAGTIIGKEDGNDDRSCGFGGDDWNAVYVEHADGSVAWYGHMKKNSLTLKEEGDPVAAGEFLGLVGSSGNSTGPHLHFEIYDADENLVEPYFGPCNDMNDESWWISQRPYYDSAINALLTHDASPEFPTCPQQEVLHDRDAFPPGATVYFGAYYRDQLQGQNTDYSVITPSAVTQWSWSHSSPDPFYPGSYWTWFDTLPATAEEGVWTFRAVYEGQTYDHLFTVCDGDATPPALTCPENITVECTDEGGTPARDPQLAPFFGGVSATDACDLTVRIEDDAPDFFPHGVTTVTFTATDDFGNQSTCSATVTVEDTTLPTIELTLNRYELWPPNHRLVTITADVEISDICDSSPTFVLTSITSDEPDNGLGDGDRPDDIQGEQLGAADTEFQLRSERQGTGDGREYTIVYTVTDGSDNSSTVTVVVAVPHDRNGFAHSSTGFSQDGTEFNPGAGTFTIVVPSTPDLDSNSLDWEQALVGNHLQVLAPLGHSFEDVDGDERVDLALTYDVAAAVQLLSLEDKEGPCPLGLRYVTSDGQGYWLQDIFQLGPPIGGPSTDVSASSPPPAAVWNVQPNPFAHIARISYTVLGRSGSPVEIAVFNVAGQRVRTLERGFQGPGLHELSWDGTTSSGEKLAAGIYFCHFSVDGKSVVKRVALVR